MSDRQPLSLGSGNVAGISEAFFSLLSLVRISFLLGRGILRDEVVEPHSLVEQ